MRALVISDTHFGAWTGRDLLREEGSLERLIAAKLPGTGVLIDDEEPEPRLVETLADLNPLGRR